MLKKSEKCSGHDIKWLLCKNRHFYKCHALSINVSQKDHTESQLSIIYQFCTCVYSRIITYIYTQNDQHTCKICLKLKVRGTIIIFYYPKRLFLVVCLL